jgi:hypothetical protein
MIGRLLPGCVTLQIVLYSVCAAYAWVLELSLPDYQSEGNHPTGRDREEADGSEHAWRLITCTCRDGGGIELPVHRQKGNSFKPAFNHSALHKDLNCPQ